MESLHKIVLIIPSLDQGGMERVMSNIANSFVNRGIETHLILLINRNIAYTVDDRVLIHFPEFEYNSSLRNKFKVLSYLIKKLREIRPTSALSFGEIFNSLSIVAGKLTGINIYISDRSSPIKSKGLINDALRKLLYPLANGLIAQTNFAKEVFKRRKYNSNIIAIPNPLKELASKNAHQERNIITVGRLVKSKNHEFIIKTYYELKAFDWHLYIVGHGPEYASLKSLCESLRISKNVTFVGSSNNVDEWLQKGTVFVYASESEGFPNALSEAVAFPVATIAFDCVAGPNEIIQNDYNGILVPLGDRERFKNELRVLLASESKRQFFEQNAIKNRRLFSLEVISEQYLNFILT